jgi:subtilase family serine protease
MKRFIFLFALLSYGYANSAAALPDVIVTQLSYANGIFTSTVVNQGTAATPAGVVIGVGYWVDGVQHTWGTVMGPLAAGASVTIGSDGGSYIISAGTHTIMAWADDVNRFAESNETNTQLTQ